MFRHLNIHCVLIPPIQLLPDAPDEVGDHHGFLKGDPVEAAASSQAVAEAPGPVSGASQPASKPVELAVPGNSVWLPDMFKKMDQPPPSDKTQNLEESGTSVAFKSANNNTSNTSKTTNVQLKKQQDAIANPPGPLPGSIYASLPGPGVKGSGTRYFITSNKGFTGGTYHAILNAQLQLVAQASSSKKTTAIEDAEKMAQINTASGKTLDRTIWSFLDCCKTGQLAKRVNLMQNPKTNTGDLPLLTHALAVDANEKARLIWLEWYAEDKKA